MRMLSRLSGAACDLRGGASGEISLNKACMSTVSHPCETVDELLLPLCHSASAIVDHRDLIQTLFQSLASRASFALYPVGCHHFSYSNTPAFAISLDVLRSGRLPRRLVTVICDSVRVNSDFNVKREAWRPNRVPRPKVIRTDRDF